MSDRALDNLFWLASFALYVAMLTAARWWH